MSNGNKKKGNDRTKASSRVGDQMVVPPTSKWYELHSKRLPWLIFAFACLIYSNTITHGYTQDDAIVIYDNMFTKEGFRGIGGHLGNDTFYGFFKVDGKAKLVSGGRYRPLTPIMFSIEYALFGEKPMAGHIINVLLYGFLCMLIYKTLLLLFKNRIKADSETVLYLFLCALIYTAHPLHTEVVANIKGRDEIMSMMGAILALLYTIKYIDSNRVSNLLWVGISFFIGLMSKENTITFLAVIPLSAYIFRSEHLRKSMTPFLVALGSTLAFLAIRSSILGMDFGGTPMELMNNPYLKIEGNQYVPFSSGEKGATIIYTLGKYLQLLIFPHPLTHDYYPRHVEMMTIGNWKVIASLLAYIALMVLAIRGIIRKSVTGYAIGFFIITISIVSNIVFPIGTNMSERFMFMPSLGFAIGLTLLVRHLLGKVSNSVPTIVLGVLIFAFAAKTYTRNFVWESDYKLFTTDVKTSNNSAKVLNAAGGALLSESFNVTNDAEKNRMIAEAIPYLKKSLSIHPNYKNAALLLGNAYSYQKDYTNAISAYERALTIAPNYAEATKNLAITYRDAGRKAGEVERDLPKAKRYLKQSLQLADNDSDTYRLLGVTEGMSGNHPEAIKYFTKVTEMTPRDASAFVNLSKAYQYYGDEENAKAALSKALQIDPNVKR